MGRRGDVERKWERKWERRGEEETRGWGEWAVFVSENRQVHVLHNMRVGCKHAFDDVAERTGIFQAALIVPKGTNQGRRAFLELRGDGIGQFMRWKIGRIGGGSIRILGLSHQLFHPSFQPDIFLQTSVATG